MWEKTQTRMEGLCVLMPFYAEDNRGSFKKLFEKDIFAQLEIPNETNEILVSSSKPGVLRGMQFQYHKPQTKCVSVLKGAIYDVAIDLRKDSPTFGQWCAVELSDRNHRVFCIPKGFAHGFQVLGTEDAIVMYQCCGKYDKQSDTGIRWDDSEIGVQWPETQTRIISDRDAGQMTFSEFKTTIGGL